MITYETTMILENSLKAAGRFYRGYDPEFGKSGQKIGSTLMVRKPPRFIGRSGAAIKIENMTDTEVPVTIGAPFGVDFQFSSSELALSIDDFSNRYLKPAAATIANKIDFDCLAMATLATFNSVGTPGTTPNSLLTYLQGGQVLDEMACPDDGERSMIIYPKARVSIVDALKGLFQDSTQIAKQYKQGKMGDTAGYTWYQDQNCSVNTVGPLGGTPVVHGANQTGSALITNGWSSSAAVRLNAGNVFTIANVYAVNPQNRVSTGALQQFVVQTTFSSDSGGAGTISIAPAIIPSGQFQNVDSIPADSAAITVVGAANTVSPQGLLFHPTAFTLAAVELDVPRGVDMGYSTTAKESKVPLRFIRDYDIVHDLWVCRFDVQYGVAPIYPELACRIQG